MTIHSDREKFLAARRSGIGGSDIAAVCGISPYATPYDVWLDKRGEGVAPDPDTPALYWGTVLEDVVAAEYSRRTAQKIQRVNALLRHPEHDFAVANIDRAIVNPEVAGRVWWKDGRLTTDRLLECKTANGFAASLWGEVGTDAVPDHYFLQCQWYMGVTSAENVDLAALIGGSDYRVFHIERNGDLIADLLEQAAAFWKLVEDGIAPDPQTVADAMHRWPQHVAGKKAVATTATVLAVEELAEVKAQISALGRREEDLKNRIVAEIGDAEELTDMGQTIATWKAQTSTRIDAKALREAHPDIADAHSVTTTTRVLRLKTKKDRA